LFLGGGFQESALEIAESWPCERAGMYAGATEKVSVEPEWDGSFGGRVNRTGVGIVMERGIPAVACDAEALPDAEALAADAVAARAAPDV
jgi:hypothetical protein